ncbi:hypothetical protein NQ317_004474 [Molorchus minor]|uniref:Uncharacterized protein n=1 Tax=Molorchus minor TaxID=1323400 RepID=A0ABQ9J419_9CUCU|nr:hypothetical protein NQ317_004474 [Molorchus minor]
MEYPSIITMIRGGYKHLPKLNFAIIKTSTLKSDGITQYVSVDIANFFHIICSTYIAKCLDCIITVSSNIQKVLFGKWSFTSS